MIVYAITLLRSLKVDDYTMSSSSEVNMDLKKLDDLETIDKQQFQFISPFRCVLYG